MARLVLHDVTKAFGRVPVLKGIDLAIEDGEFLAVLGPSGCGKSTLLRVIAGLEAHDRGRVLIDGRPVDDLPPKARDVAVVFQSYALYPHMTVAQNLSLPLAMRDLTRAQRLPFARHFDEGTRRTRREIRAKIERAAALVGIADFLARKPAQLSGGQRQRVALARALVREPKLFLLDEPLSNLDATLRASTRAEIVALQRRLGTTTVYVTHDQAEAMTMADRIAILIDGQVVQLGTAREIYDRPADVRSALFIGSPRMNLFEAAAEDGRIRLSGSSSALEQPTRLAGPVRIGVRPEHVTLAPPSADAMLHGRLTHLEFLGSEALAHLSVGEFASASSAIARLDPDTLGRFRVGDRVGVGFKADRIHCFGPDGARCDPWIESASAGDARLGLLTGTGA